MVYRIRNTELFALHFRLVLPLVGSSGEGGGELSKECLKFVKDIQRGGGGMDRFPLLSYGFCTSIIRLRVDL